MMEEESIVGVAEPRRALAERILDLEDGAYCDDRECDFLREILVFCNEAGIIDAQEYDVTVAYVASLATPGPRWWEEYR